jgi:CRISP-associated protein Cas1
MAVVYITDQGSSLTKKGDRFYIKKGNQIIRWVLAKDVEQLILLGNIALTAQCAGYLLRNRIDTVFMTYYGSYKGRLVGEFGKNVTLRIDQFRCLQDHSEKLYLAKEFVKAKIYNSAMLMKRRNYKYRNESIKKTTLQNMAIYKYNLENCDCLNSLRGYEGIAAKNYFAAFPAIIKNDDFPFTGRNKRPPKDEVNALLSLSYTFLLSHVLSKVYITGLDPYYGSLHEVEYGRQSLVLDLMEEFRPIVDDMIITMINKRDIRKEHFVYNSVQDTEFDEDFQSEQSYLPVSLNKEGMKKIVYRFSRLCNNTYYYPALKCNLSLNQIMLAQARKIASHFKGDTEYEGFTISF